jgi:hypothetical protein
VLPPPEDGAASVDSSAHDSDDLSIPFDLHAHVQRRQLWRQRALRLGLLALIGRFLWSLYLLFATQQHGRGYDAEAAAAAVLLSQQQQGDAAGATAAVQATAPGGGAGSVSLTLTEQRQLLRRYLGQGGDSGAFGAGVLPPASGNILDLLMLLKSRIVGGGPSDETGETE